MTLGQERREKKIRTLAELLLAGKSIKASAEAMGVSRQTAHRYLADARKLIADGIITVATKEGGVSEDGGKPKSDEEIALDASLEELRERSRQGLEVGPEWAVIMSRKVQLKAMDELDGDKLNAREMAQALQAVETARKSAESSINMRSKLTREIAEEMLWALRRVAGADVYARVLNEFLKHGVEGELA